jgi:hypothetical protein
MAVYHRRMMASEEPVWSERRGRLLWRIGSAVKDEGSVRSSDVRWIWAVYAGGLGVELM